MNKPLRILMVEDSEDDALLAVHALRKGGYDPRHERVETAEAMRKALEDGSWDVILCDYQMPRFNGLAAITLLKETGIDIPLIIVSGAIDEETAAECMRMGAHDFFTKGRISRLPSAVDRELQEAETRRQRKRTEELLRESEQKYRLLVENTSEAIVVVQDGRARFVNRGVEWAGYNPEEYMSIPIMDTVHPEDREVVEQRYLKKIRGDRTPTRHVYRGLDKSGRIHWIEVSSVRIDWEGRPATLNLITDITERKLVEETIRKSRESFERQAGEKAIIAEIGRVVGSTLDIHLVYERVATEIRKLIHYDRFLVNQKISPDDRFIVAYASGIENPGRRIGDVFPCSGSATGDVINSRTGILIQPTDAEEIKDLYPNLYESFKTGLRSTMSVPLISMDEVIGSMSFRSAKLKAYTEQDLHLVEGIGRQIAGAITNAQLFTERRKAEAKLQDTLESLRKAVGTTIRVMVSAVEARDPYTSGHQIRSAALARAIATEMGLPQEKVDGIRMAGSIHDIGKLSIPAEILSKPTRLSEIEFRLIQEHARQGYEILKDVESPWPLAEIIHQHHERIDGSGYPRKLKGDAILIEARILTVADVVEAMASHRPYRPGLGIDAALEEIGKNRGILYDDAVADACLRLFRERGFKLEGP